MVGKARCITSYQRRSVTLPSLTASCGGRAVTRGEDPERECVAGLRTPHLVRELEAMTPQIEEPFSADLIAPLIDPRIKIR